jgi:aminopeptidase
MRDPRIARVADILVNYSTSLQPGEQVLIHGAPVAEPMLLEIYRSAVRAGAHPLLLIQPTEANEILFRDGNDAQVQFLSPFVETLFDRIDCRIALWAEENTKSLSNVDPARQVLRAQAMRPFLLRNLGRMGDPGDPFRWVGALFPTHAHAQDAEMSLSDYADFVFGACLPSFDDLPEDARAFATPGADPANPITYWETFSRWQGQLASYLNDKAELHLVGPNIDLHVGIAGRTWLNADGHANFPDGEVFTGPVEDAVDGWVAFTYPAIYNDRAVRDVRLRFERGRVVEATASHGEDFLTNTLDADDGARRLGEFAIGTNPKVTRFTGNTLFDEKIKGTCHMAVGASIPGTGGMNQSAVHWDMVCDLRKDSRIYADGQLFYENGEFIIRFAGQAHAHQTGVGAGSMAKRASAKA